MKTETCRKCQMTINDLYDDKKNKLCIFHCDKTNWYVYCGDEKIWDEKKVDYFWQVIRSEKMQKSDFNFNKYIFPSCQKVREDRVKLRGSGRYIAQETFDFWEKGEEVCFDNEVDFHRAIFLGKAGFIGTRFFQCSDFSGVEFADEIVFLWSYFLKKANFGYATFKKTFYSEIIFREEISFEKATFFHRVIFEDNSGGHSTIPEFDFSRVVFPNGTLFRNVNLSKTQFQYAYLNDVLFQECIFKIDESDEFGIIGDECKLNEELKGKMQCKSDKDKIRMIRGLSSIESIYIQLKKNFENKGEYYQASDFYLGEMRMRKKRLFIQNDRRIERAVIKLYEFISNFGEDPVRIIEFLFIVIFLCWYIWVIVNI